MSLLASTDSPPPVDSLTATPPRLCRSGAGPYVERLGFEAFLGQPNILTRMASPAPPPALLLGCLAAGTSRIRLGSDVLPNHAPLVIEQFSAWPSILTVSSWALGRAPGADPVHHFRRCAATSCVCR
jgi:hypothetical protein